MTSRLPPLQQKKFRKTGDESILQAFVCPRSTDRRARSVFLGVELLCTCFVIFLSIAIVVIYSLFSIDFSPCSSGMSLTCFGSSYPRKHVLSFSFPYSSIFPLHHRISGRCSRISLHSSAFSFVASLILMECSVKASCTRVLSTVRSNDGDIIDTDVDSNRRLCAAISF